MPLLRNAWKDLQNHTPLVLLYIVAMMTISGSKVDLNVYQKNADPR